MKAQDINPIENLWSIVDRRIDCEGITTKEQLIVAVKNAWDQVTLPELRKLISSVPRRIESVIERQGHHTTY